MEAAVLEAGGVVSALLALPLLQTNRLVTEPYMDEIFHAAQTQQYCEGDFTTWDPKITTFPGLYYAGLASARCVPVTRAATAREGFGESAQSACSLTSLRAVNAVFGVLSFLAMALFFATRGFRPVSAVLHAAALTLYAPHFFYHSLYYTDPGATCLVILMLLAARREHHSLAAILGALAIFFRQNNVVWVAFALGAAALRVVGKKTCRQAACGP
eukprot:scaffold878_cov271-Pinguiococcus_pyrenoidosus.AAC.38